MEDGKTRHRISREKPISHYFGGYAKLQRGSTLKHLQRGCRENHSTGWVAGKE
jgi:hypothetical protein